MGNVALPLSGNYDVVCDIPGNLANLVAGATIQLIRFGRRVAFPQNFFSSTGYCNTNPTSTASFTIKQNGSSVGTISVSTSGIFTFTSSGGNPVYFSAGDVLSITTPSPQDATLADVSLLLAGFLLLPPGTLDF